MKPHMSTLALRNFLYVGCEAGHDMQSIGGCNAGCDPDCSCSVPVHTCTRCGDCDYGKNEEADRIRARCAEDWCKCGRGATNAEHPCCDYSGRCEAAADAEGITNCIHCGKELHERDGQWWTHDADQYSDPKPQRG